MNLRLINKFSIFLTGIILVCCSKIPDSFEYKVDSDLKPYLNKFLEEAKLKGKTFDTTNLIMKFGKATLETCGECMIANKGKGQRTIIIDTTERLCWKGSVSQNRESLVFHELGHCLLNRSHRNDLLPVLNKDAPASIMNVTPLGLYEPCVYQLGDPKDCDKRYRRVYYISELFDSKTPIPNW